MAELYGFYRCTVCGNVVRVELAGVGKLVCCGREMVREGAIVEDTGYEKHLPTVEGNVVKVGSVPHPMEDGHYIAWIEALGDDWRHIKYLKPGDKPEAEFPRIPGKVRAYCNIHGLWERG